MSASRRQLVRRGYPSGGGLAIAAFSAVLIALPLVGQEANGTTAPDRIAAVDAAMRTGIAAANANDLAAARNDFAHAVELAPEIEATHAALGSVLLAQGDLKAAQAELLRAHQLDPGDTSATVNLGRVESLLGEASAAVPLFEGALAAPDPPTLSAEETIAFAKSLSAASRGAEAEVQLEDALRRTPDSAPLHDALGALLAQTGHTEQALTHFQEAAALEPSLPETQYLLGAALLSLGHAEEAIAPLGLAVAAIPDRFEAHLQYGRALSATHRDKEALVALHRAAELRGPDAAVDATYALALAMDASGDAAASLPLFAAATGSPAGSALGNAALINYALALVQTGDASGAVRLYERALVLGPDSATLREDYGVAYLQQADLDHAIAQFRAGVAMAPQSAQLHYDLGLALKLKDDLNGAISELTRGAALDATLPDPAYTLGVIYMQQGRFAEAAAQLRMVTALQPANGEAWAMLGGVLKDSDDSAGAIDAIHHAAALEPEQPSLHVQLAALLVRTGQPAQAAAERKLAADLSRAAVSKQRATFALKSGRALLAGGKLPEAIVQLKTASDADPQLAECHALLAEALSRQGKLAEAALERQRADALQATAASAAP
jgi:protein O-GlcNAc transferase